MKNSGIEWIGEIPDDWNLIKVGSIFQCRNEKVNDTDYPPLSVSKGGVVPQMDSVAKSDANDNRKLVLQNDFVINSRSDRKQSCGYSTLKGSVSLINTVLYTTNNEIIMPQYTDYLMKNYGFAEEFYRWGHGIVADLWTTRWQEMKSIVLPIPSIDIQQKIADYLDKKCAAVDRLIENQRAQIEKLKEYKQSVITKAVTRGLDPSAPLKDSDIEWVGKIPAGWEIVYLSSIFNEHKRKNTGLICTNLLSLSYGNIKQKDINATEGLLPESFEGYNIIEKGDIVLRLTDLQNDQKSLRTGIAREVGIVTSAYITIRCLPQIALPDYMHYYLHSFDISKGFYGMGNGVRQGLNYDGIKKILVLLPPLEEQQQITDYLDKKCAEIDKLIAIKQQKIETLTEYKKSLIYEYVTGKKQVG